MRDRLIALATALLLGIAGLAAPTTARARACDAIGVVEFGSAITSVKVALDRGFADGAKRVIHDLHGDIACLDFAPPPSLWADWLFLVALTRHADGHAGWELPLARALALNPALDRRMVAKTHPLRSWTPPPVTATPAPLPFDSDEVRIWVDGVETDVVADPDGLHLIQIQNGTWWDSVLVEGRVAAARGLWVPRRQPKRTRTRLQGFGLSGVHQIRWTLPDQVDRDGPGAVTWPWAVGLRGSVTVGHLAARAQVAYDEKGQAPLFWAIGVDVLGVGAGIGATAERFIAHDLLLDPDRPLRERWFPDAAISLWRDKIGVGRGVDGFAVLSFTRLAANVGLWPQRARDPAVRYRLGLLGSARRVFLVDESRLVVLGDEMDVRYRSVETFAGLELSIEVIRRDTDPLGDRAPASEAPPTLQADGEDAPQADGDDAPEPASDTAEEAP